MDNRETNILKLMRRMAYSDHREINVFDLMYEASLAYGDLKEILNRLISQNLVENIDRKTYKFIGNEDCEFNDNETNILDTPSERVGSDDDEDYYSVEFDDVENRRRREYLERRRREIIARLQKENDNEEEDSSDPFEEDDESDTDNRVFLEKSDEEILHEKLLGLLIDEERNSKLAVSALKLCAGEGYVSSWLLCKNLGIDENTADFVCFWLYVNDFIRRDIVDENRYLLNVPESLFFACCHEAEERKKSLGKLASTLKNICEQKQKNEQEKKTSHQRHINSIQFKKLAHAKLIALVCTDLKMTRAKAITKAEGCLYAARDIGNDEEAAVYEEVIFELSNMSDYMFNRLKSQQED